MFALRPVIPSEEFDDVGDDKRERRERLLSIVLDLQTSAEQRDSAGWRRWRDGAERKESPFTLLKERVRSLRSGAPSMVGRLESGDRLEDGIVVRLRFGLKSLGRRAKVSLDISD